MLAALAALERGDACISAADGAARICLAGNVRSMSGATLSVSWFVLSEKEAPDTWAERIAPIVLATCFSDSSGFVPLSGVNSRERFLEAS